MQGENPVITIRHAAATAKINVTKLRSNVSVLEGSGGNITALTGRDGKVLVDAGITASRPQITEALASLSDEPVKHLINSHWHFDHTDGNEWLHSVGAEITAHENTRNFLLLLVLKTGISPSRPRRPVPCRQSYSIPNKLCISTEQPWH